MHSLGYFLSKYGRDDVYTTFSISRRDIITMKRPQNLKVKLIRNIASEMDWKSCICDWLQNSSLWLAQPFSIKHWLNTDEDDHLVENTNLYSTWELQGGEAGDLLCIHISASQIQKKQTSIFRKYEGC